MALKKNRKGFALVLTVLILLFLSLIVLHLLSLIHSDALSQGYEEKFIHSEYLADACIQDVVANLEKNEDWEPSDWGTQFKGYPGKEYPSGSGNGYNIDKYDFTSNSTKLPGGNRIVKFEAKGYYKDIERAVNVSIAVTKKSDGTIIVKVFKYSD